VNRRSLYIATSVVFWLLTAAVYWAVLETLASGCELQEKDSGLSAECFAPAGVFFSLAFLVLLVVDVFRTIFALRTRRGSSGNEMRNPE